MSTLEEHTRTEATKEMGEVIRIFEEALEEMKKINFDAISEELLVNALTGLKFLSHSAGRTQLVAMILSTVSTMNRGDS